MAHPSSSSSPTAARLPSASPEGDSISTRRRIRPTASSCRRARNARAAASSEESSSLAMFALQRAGPASVSRGEVQQAPHQSEPQEAEARQYEERGLELAPDPPAAAAPRPHRVVEHDQRADGPEPAD